MTRTLISQTMKVGRAAGLAEGLAITLGIGTAALAAVPGDWSYTSNNLSVMFVPAERGAVTSVGDTPTVQPR